MLSATSPTTPSRTSTWSEPSPSTRESPSIDTVRRAPDPWVIAHPHYLRPVTVSAPPDSARDC